MTYSEFRYSLIENLLPTDPTTIIVNYNTVGGVTTIDDVAILIEGNLPQLQEATSISLHIPQAGGIVNINVEPSASPLRVVDRGVVGPYYCYGILTPEQRPIIVLPQQQPDPEEYHTGVVIEPITATGAYNYNTYNPLIGNTSADRESSYRVYCDRGTTTALTKTNPVNIFSILSDQAVHANVQDSLYSDTGWIQGRYEGSKLTTDTNYGTDPALGGTFFEGVFFGADIDDATILAFSTSDLTYKEYFSVGTSQVPRYEIEFLNLNTNDLGTPLPPTALQISMYSIYPSTPLRKELEIGDLFIFSGSTGIGNEVIQMVPPPVITSDYPYRSVTRTTTQDFVTIEVARSFEKTPAVQLQLEEKVYRLRKNKIYSIEGTITQALPAGKLRVKGLDEVLYIGPSGYVINGSNIVEL